MKKRGGGIIDIELINRTSDMKGYYQINVSFDTEIGRASCRERV